MHFVDRAIAANWLAVFRKLPNNVVTERNAASALAATNFAEQAAMSLRCNLLELKSAHRAFEPDVQLSDQTFFERMNLDVTVRRTNENVRRSLLASAQAVQRLRDDNIEHALANAGEQLLHARSNERSATDGMVRENMRHLPSTLLSELAADMKLVIN